MLLPNSNSATDKALEALPVGRFHHYLTFVCGLANASDCVEVTCVSFIVPVISDEWALSGLQKGFLTAAIFLGMLIGGWVWGAAADSLGRRRCLLWALIANAVFGVLSGLTPSYPWMLVARFVSGFGVGGSTPILFTYASEFLPSAKRGQYLVWVACFWMVGGLVTAGMAWGMLSGEPHWRWGSFTVASWRVFVIACAVPSALAALTLWPMPESPKFMAQHGQAEQSLRLLKAVERLNNQPSVRCCWCMSRVADDHHDDSDHDVSHQHLHDEHESSESAGAVSLSLSSASASASSSSSSMAAQGTASSPPVRVTTVVLAEQGPASESDEQHQPQFAPLLERKGLCGTLRSVWEKTLLLFQAGLRRNTLILLGFNFTFAFAYYGLTLWVPEYFKSQEGADTYLDSFISTIATLPGNLISAYTVQWIGPPRSILISVLLAACSILFLLTTHTIAGAVAVISVFQGVSVITWNSLNIVSTELFPTHLRSSAFGFFNVNNRIGSIVGNLVYGLFIDSNPGFPLLVTAIMLVIAAGLSLLLPKFKHTPGTSFTMVHH